ncbi:MAG: hypothetical protein B7Z73_01120 [Planctomycetia bacterium 21-64-5]|nr:MAG: hypothetical protein B7Z73_01120 [Planctomycetia bacterium 21-64-5]
MSGGDDPLLSVRGVVMRFGGVIALGGVSFDVHRNQICGLIGPNGSGKTTLFNCISGIYRYNDGDIVFDGTSLTGRPRCSATPRSPSPGCRSRSTTATCSTCLASATLRHISSAFSCSPKAK